MLKNILWLSVVSMTVGVVTSQAVCDADECSNAMFGGVPAAYYICRQALVDKAFTSDLSSYDLTEVQGVCQGFCYDGSRTDGRLGSVWDVCAGCDLSVTSTICGFCDAADSNDVGHCNGPFHESAQCIYQDGDGRGDSEEEIGTFPTNNIAQSKSDCFDLVRNHRPLANGATFDTIFGTCYAEYNVAGVPSTDVTGYVSCAFAFGAPTAAVTTTPPAVTTPPPAVTTTPPAVTTTPESVTSGSGSGEEPTPDSKVVDVDPDEITHLFNKGGKAPDAYQSGSRSNKGSNKPKKEKKEKKAKDKKGKKKGKKGKKGDLAFFAESKNVAGVSAGAVIVLVAASAFAVQRRRRLVKQSQAYQDQLLEGVYEHTPLLNSPGSSPARGVMPSLEETVPIMH